MYTSDVDLRLISAALIKPLENPVGVSLPFVGSVRCIPRWSGHSFVLQFEPDLFVVVWLDQGLDPFQDLCHSYSRGFRSFQSFGRLRSLALVRLHPYSEWMVFRIDHILPRNAPWLCSCNMVLLNVGVVFGSVPVVVGLVYDTLPL